ncbi:hypothetical protein J6590_107826, partial [Homalodisca vitripennis]
TQRKAKHCRLSRQHRVESISRSLAPPRLRLACHLSHCPAPASRVVSSQWDESY